MNTKFNFRMKLLSVVVFSVCVVGDCFATQTVPPRISLGGDVRNKIVGFHSFKKNESLFNFVKRIGGFKVRVYTARGFSPRERLTLYLFRSTEAGQRVKVFHIECDAQSASKFILKPGDTIEVTKFKSPRYEEWEEFKKQPINNRIVFFEK